MKPWSKFLTPNSRALRASGFLSITPHPGEPTPPEVRERGTSFCVGTPEACIRFLEQYEALGIEEVFLLCAIGPAQHQEVLHTIRLFGEHVIPYFQAKAQRAAGVQTSA
jgi:alkanesulfonate monooxygenase SsuD/methylene tetrahydromethanopterin reductase-like flavin-dependent oxidoreductase (luciferase family)